MALICTFMIMGAGGIASAAPTQDTSDPQHVTYETFFKIEDGLTDASMRRNHENGSTEQQAAQADSCLTYTLGVNGKAHTGIVIYKFGETVGWCYNGSSVTYHEYNYIIEAYTVWH